MVANIQFSIADNYSEDGYSEFLAGNIFEPANDGRVNIDFSLLNDNTYGLYESVSGKKLGDDFGDTHGVVLEFSRVNEQGINYKLVYFTNLFTERLSDRYHTESWGRTYDQQFTEENIVKILVDNKEQDPSQYYEAGVGVVELNHHELRGWLTASGQQLYVHDTIGLFHPNNLPNNRDNQVGSFVEARIGNEYVHISENEKVRIVGDVNFHGLLNSIKDASSASISAGADVYYQSSENSWAYKVGAKVTSTSHQTGNRPMNSLDLALGVGKGKYSFEFSFKKYLSGDKQNYQAFNDDRDSIITLQFKGKFGLKRK
jgi:hypothetical protein